MAFIHQDGLLGLPPINSTDTTQRVREGFIAHAVDQLLGGGEFIYLKGVVGTVAGSLVSYDPLNHTTTLGPPAAANSGAPLAVAMSANVANQWGWYMISGTASAAQKDATSFAVGDRVGLGTVAGKVGALTAGKQILGAAANAIAAGGAATASIYLSRPHAQGAIT